MGSNPLFSIIFLFFASPCATLRFGGVWRTLRLAPPRHTSFVLCVVRPWPALRASARATIRGQLRERPHARANQKPVSCTVAAAPRAIFVPCAFQTANQRGACCHPRGPKQAFYAAYSSGVCLKWRNSHARTLPRRSSRRRALSAAPARLPRRWSSRRPTTRRHRARRPRRPRPDRRSSRPTRTRRRPASATST